MDLQIAVPVSENSQTGEARRRAAQLAAECGLPEGDAGRLAIVVTELARNLTQHAGNGELLLRSLKDMGGVEVLALDKGPGMSDIAESLRDGYSTAGTPGTGLGAVRRLSDTFEIYSAPSRGTVVLSRILARNRGASHRAWDVGVVAVPLRGEGVSGDTWDMVQQRSGTLFMMADGVGHGPGALEAAVEARHIFLKYAGRESHEILEALHFALHKTRGAAVSLARLDTSTRELHYLGVGNISAAISSPDGVHNLVSHNGTVGHIMSRVQEFRYPFPPGAALLMHSDGLATWHLDKYTGLLGRHPSVVAGVLYRDFTRGRDDVTVLVARETLE